MESPETSEILGIARKLNKEMEELPIHCHASVISILNTLMQTRQLNMQIKREEENAARQREAAEQQMQHAVRQAAAGLKLQ